MAISTKTAKTESVTLLEALRREREEKISGGIYHRVQIELTYNSNHIEGSHLFKECLRYQIVPFIITDEIKFFYYRGLQM